MKSILTLSVVALIALSVQPAAGRDDPKGDHSDNAMKRKLHESQKILEAIALNDFDNIEKHADELLLISREARWKVLKTSSYEMYSNSFQRAAADLSKQARNKDIDAAALSYVELTLSCVKCHKHVREERKKGAD